MEFMIISLSIELILIKHYLILNLLEELWLLLNSNYTKRKPF